MPSIERWSGLCGSVGGTIAAAAAASVGAFTHTLASRSVGRSVVANFLPSSPASQPASARYDTSVGKNFMRFAAAAAAACSQLAPATVSRQ